MKRHPPTTSHNYVPKVLKLAEQIAADTGAVYATNVCHDEWCDFLNERGYCNCDPVIKIVHRHGKPTQ